MPHISVYLFVVLSCAESVSLALWLEVILLAGHKSNMNQQTWNVGILEGENPHVILRMNMRDNLHLTYN